MVQLDRVRMERRQGSLAGPDPHANPNSDPNANPNSDTDAHSYTDANPYAYGVAEWNYNYARRWLLY
jgi:hypothetical protein